MKIKNRIKNSGFTLIEALISLLIISIFVIGTYQLIIFSLKITADNKLRLAAVTIADQKIELVRNLPYNDVGTTQGMVHGVIADNETLIHNNGTFFINTLVQYIDDPFDGTSSSSPKDLLANDYKQVRIRVRWTGPFGTKNVTAFTKVVPRGIESNLSGGILIINVFNARGIGVEGANVAIKNTSVNPIIDFSTETDASGNLIFPGAPTSTEGYEITVTKSGYSTSSTSPRTVVNPNPTIPNATVLKEQITEIGFAIDLLSNLKIKTINQNLPDNWKVNTDASEENQVNARMDIDSNGYIYLVWQDYRNGPSSRIYGQKYSSTTTQAQWPADIIISTAMNQILPDIKVDNSGDLYVSWNDNSNGNQDSFLIKRASADGGDLWGGSKKIDTQADSKDQTNPRIALSKIASPQNIIVVWSDNRNTQTDIFLKIYDINKNNVLSPEIKVNTNFEPTGTNQYSPTLAIDSSDNIYVAWTDERNGNKDVYAQKYNLGGINQWASDIFIGSLSASTSEQYSPAVAIDSSDNIYLSWTDERNGNKDVYLQKYNTSSAAVWGSEIRVGTISASSSNQYSSSLAVDSIGNIYVAWTDERNSNQDIYAQKYDNSGNSLWIEDIRANVNTSTSAQYNPALAINPANDDPYAVWQDERFGDTDIFAAKIGPYGAISYVPEMPLTIISAKKIGENPIIYKYNKNYTSNGMGEVALTGIEWDSYSIILNPNYLNYSIIATDPPLPLSLDPNTSREIILYLE
jgi:prepilin-type N-terminal cleavage/methylation domain-containing protein